jgi:hypothetical protein
MRNAIRAELEMIEPCNRSRPTLLSARSSMKQHCSLGKNQLHQQRQWIA